MKKVFYAWQSDLPNATNRRFIEECLNSAILEVNKAFGADQRLSLDKDTQGEVGMVAISDTILRKIEACTVFVPDLSIVTATGSGRQMPNGNVLFELGYAMSAISEHRVVSVFNESFGSRKDLPFDIQHRRWPISYSLSDTATVDERKKAQNTLVPSLVKAIRASAEHASANERGLPTPSALTPLAFGSYDLPARFQNGRAIATVGAGTPGVGADGKVIYRHAPHAFLDLRPAESRNTDSWTTLRDRAVRESFHLTAFGPRGSQCLSRNENGMIAVDLVSNPQQANALCFTQLYKSTGGLYGVNQAIAMNDGKRSFIAADKMRSDFVLTLENYLNFYRLNSDLPAPLKLYTGFDYSGICILHWYSARSPVGRPVRGQPAVARCRQRLARQHPHELLRPLFSKLWDNVELTYRD